MRHANLNFVLAGIFTFVGIGVLITTFLSGGDRFSLLIGFLMLVYAEIIFNNGLLKEMIFEWKDLKKKLGEQMPSLEEMLNECGEGKDLMQKTRKVKAKKVSDRNRK